MVPFPPLPALTKFLTLVFTNTWRLRCVRNDTLLNRFRITPDEERRMSTIISATEKYRRLCAKRAPGIAARREAKAELHNQIRVAVRSGALSQAEAARTFGLTPGRVSQILSNV